MPAAVLDNYTKLVLDKGASLSSADLALRDLLLPAGLLPDSGRHPRGRGQDRRRQGRPAVGSKAETEAYYRLFRTRLALQVQNFMDNTWRLIAAHVSLAHTSGFLPAETPGIAAGPSSSGPRSWPWTISVCAPTPW